MNLVHKIQCIESVKMDETGEVVFTKGKVYKANLDARWINAINDLNELHCLGTLTDKDRFFKTHFVVVNA